MAGRGLRADQCERERSRLCVMLRALSAARFLIGNAVCNGKKDNFGGTGFADDGQLRELHLDPHRLESEQIESEK
jgi:hypothetical protein